MRGSCLPIEAQPYTVELFTSLAHQRPVENRIVSMLWIVGAVGIIAAIVLAMITAWRGDGKSHDLGSVSSQWVAEHRTSGQAEDRNR